MDYANKAASQKVRTLMRANDILTQKLQAAKLEGKDNYRVKMIKNLRIQLREVESINEALKEHVINNGSSIEQIDDLYESVLNAPKRVRPVRVETLQRQIAALKRENEKLKTNASNKSSRAQQSRNRVDKPEGNFALEQELSVIQTELEAKENALEIHKQMLQSVQQTNRDLRGFKAEAARAEERLVEVEQENASLKEQLLASVGQDENYYQEIRMLRAKIAQLSRDKEKGQHALHANSQYKDKQLEQQKDREQHLMSQITLLKADVKTAHEIAQWHKTRAEEAKNQAPDDVKNLHLKIRELELMLQNQTLVQNIDIDNDTATNKTTTEGGGGGKATDQLRSQNIVLNGRVESLEFKILQLQDELKVKASVIIDLEEAQRKENINPISSNTTTTATSINETEKQMVALKVQYSQKLQTLHMKISDLEKKLMDSNVMAEKDHSHNITLRKTNAKQLENLEILRRKLTILEQENASVVKANNYNQLWCEKLKNCVSNLTQHIDTLEGLLNEHHIEIPTRPAFVVT